MRRRPCRRGHGATIRATIRRPHGRRPAGRPTIAADKAQSWAYTEDFITEDDVVADAHARADELGCGAVSAGTGAALRLLAAAAGARAVVEIGTGTGVSGLWLLGGMAADGVLTTIDIDTDHQRAAREAFAAAGVKPARTRLISGRAQDVLPRMADGAYDLVLVDGDPTEAAESVEQAVRMLRVGGILAVPGALWFDRVADPARRDEATVAMRELGRTVREDERLTSVLLPSGSGLLAAVRRS